MQLTVCGFGGAGSRLADRIVADDAGDDGREREGPSMVAGAVALDTDRTALAALEAIPEADRHHYAFGVESVADTPGDVEDDDTEYGDTERVDSADVDTERDDNADVDAERNASGRDVQGDDGKDDRESGNRGGGDRDRGAAAAEAHHAALSRIVTDAVTTETDAILCCVGLAGGSGATAVPPLAAELRRVVDRPIYGLGLLPAEELPPSVRAEADSTAKRANQTVIGAREESLGDAPTWAINAGRALEELTVATDSLVCFDTADWLGSGESIDDPAVRRRCNDDLARRIGTLFRAGEIDPEGPIAERVVDAAELTNTFDAGGIATLGYASQTVERPRTSRFGLGLFERLGEVETTASIKAVDTTVRRAVRGKLTVEVDRGSTSRGLLIVGGPPEWLNREAVSAARAWLTEETASVQMRTGDMPTPEGSAVFAVVLLAGVEDCPRVDTLRRCAERARRRTR